MLPIISNRATCDLKKIRNPTAEAVTTVSHHLWLVTNQVGLAEEKFINTNTNKKCLHEQVTSNHLSHIPIILMYLSKYTEITSLLSLVLLKEKTEQKGEERRKKNEGSFDAEFTKTIKKVQIEYGALHASAKSFDMQVQSMLSIGILN